jgi:hypothetical protein
VEVLTHRLEWTKSPPQMATFPLPHLCSPPSPRPTLQSLVTCPGCVVEEVNPSEYAAWVHFLPHGGVLIPTSLCAVAGCPARPPLPCLPFCTSAELRPPPGAEVSLLNEWTRLTPGQELLCKGLEGKYVPLQAGLSVGSTPLCCDQA